MASEPHDPPLLNVAGWLERSEANGPGVRFVLWLQGCPLRCPGCWNPQTWDPAKGIRMPVETVLSHIRAVPGIEGVTVTGGEPFAQAKSLLHLARGLRRSGLSLMVFTGYDLGELTDEASREILACTDILVAGRFVLAERDLSLRWRGSRNQRIHFLSGRYGPGAAQGGGEAEVIIDDSGRLTITGFPDPGLIAGLSGPASSGNAVF